MLKESSPYPLSRSNIDLFLNCQRCFYLHKKLGLKLPNSTSYMLNHAVDKLLKREFNHYRLFALKHPVMKEHDLDAIPFFHEKMEQWQDTVNGGVQFYHEPTNFMVKGSIDDLWVNAQEEIIVVDYKATAIKGSSGPTGKWLTSCQRQLDVYAWLLENNGFNTHQTGYLLYCNGNTSQKKFNVTLDFKVSLIPHTIDMSWIETTLLRIQKCLQRTTIPAFTKKCQICHFVENLEALKVS